MVVVVFDSDSDSASGVALFFALAGEAFVFAGVVLLVVVALAGEAFFFAGEALAGDSFLFLVTLPLCTPSDDAASCALVDGTARRGELLVAFVVCCGVAALLLLLLPAAFLGVAVAMMREFCLFLAEG